MLYLSGYENGMRRRKTKCGLALVDNRASHGAVISSFQCFLFCRFFGVSYTTDEILCQKSSHSKWIFHEANNMLNSGERLMLYSSMHVYTAKVPRSRIAFGCCCFSFFLLSSPPLSSDPWAHIARFVRDTPQQASLCVRHFQQNCMCAFSFTWWRMIVWQYKTFSADDVTQFNSNICRTWEAIFRSLILFGVHFHCVYSVANTQSWRIAEEKMVLRTLRPSSRLRAAWRESRFTSATSRGGAMLRQ